jgi:hypothetical protein
LGGEIVKRLLRHESVEGSGVRWRRRIAQHGAGAHHVGRGG